MFLIVSIITHKVLATFTLYSSKVSTCALAIWTGGQFYVVQSVVTSKITVCVCFAVASKFSIYCLQEGMGFTSTLVSKIQSTLNFVQ